MKFIKIFKSLWRFFEEDKVRLILFVIISFVAAFQFLVYPYLYSKAVSFLFDKNFNEFLLFLSLWSGFGVIARFTIEIPQEYLRNKLEIKFIKKLNNELNKKIIDLPCDAHEKHGIGELSNRIQTDPDRIIDLIGKLIRFISRLITVLIIVVYSYFLSKILLIEILVFIVITVIISKHYNPKIKNIQKEIKTNQDDYSKHISQTLFGIREIKALGIKNIINKFTNKKVASLFKNHESIKLNELKYDNFMWGMHDILEYTILFTCGYLFFKGIIPLESFVMFEMYLYRIHDVVESYSEYNINYNRVIVSMNRISEIVNNELYEDEKFGNKVLRNSKGLIEFKDVYFAYDNGRPTLKGVNLIFNPNKKIAIVGRSGMGKSTIFNLLARFFDANKGIITIDGINIKDICEKSLRDNISVIRQDPYLFNMTVKENFKLINSRISLKAIRTACKKAFIDDYIMSLPDKYNTVIGEGGVNLSGGQKQRLAIARALAKNSKIILFDEATSALDNNSQSYIKQAIDELASSHTIIIIAHRLTTIIDADEIVVVHNGKVQDSGTHNYLIDNNDLYRKLYSGELT